ncbi:hypothetical protein [Gimesia panareensis]|nr:hypothetical protein [Gimesia panareensis]
MAGRLASFQSEWELKHQPAQVADGRPHDTRTAFNQESTATP